MAQQLDIVIKVKQVGQEAITDLNRRLDALKNSIAHVNFAPLAQFSQQVAVISSHVANLNKQVTGAISSVVNQTTSGLQQTVDNLSKNTEASIERTYTRVAAGVLAMTAFAGTSTLNLATLWIAKAKTAISDVGAFFVDRFNDIASFGRNLLVGTTDIISSLFKIENTSKAAFATVGGGAAYALTFLKQLGTFGVTVTILKAFMGEGMLFVRRFFGKGLESLTLLERVTRTITTIDSTLHSIGLTGGQLLRTVGLIGSAIGIWIFGPVQSFLLFIPVLNSAVSNIFSFYARGRAQFWAFFGSASAQLKLIFGDFKKFLIEALPGFTAIGKSMSLLQVNAGSAAKEIKKTGQASEPLLLLAKTKFPFTVQLQSIFFELKTLLASVNTSLNALLAMIAKVFNIGEADVKKITDDASQMTKTLMDGANGTIKAFEKLATDKKPSLWARGISFAWASMKATFAGGGREIISSIDAVIAGVKAAGSAIVSPFAKIATRIFTKKTQPLAVAAEPVVTKEASDALLWLRNAAQAYNKEDLAKKANEDAAAFNTLRKKIWEFSVALEKIASGENLKNFDKTFTAMARALGELFGKADLQYAFKGMSSKDLQALFPKDTVKQFVAQMEKDLQAMNVSGFRNKLSGFLYKLFSGKALPEGLSGDAGTGTFMKAIRGLIPMALASGKEITGALAQGETAELKKLEKATDTTLDTVAVRLPKSPAKLGPLVGLSKSGGKIVEQIATGMTGAINYVTNAAGAIAERIAGFFPRSPALYGALRSLSKSGGQIPAYIGQGITAGTKSVTVATSAMAERIAEYFPRSLPVAGPLIGLVSFGIKIPFYIGKGILSGINFVLDAVKNLADKISEKVQDAVSLRQKSIKLGISVENLSALDAALKMYGSSVSDAEFSIAKMQEILSRGIETDDAKKLAVIGISLDKVKASADPAMALFLQLSDVINDSEVGTERYRVALEVLGTMLGSNLVVAMGRGSAGLRSDMKSAVDEGVIYTTRFATAAVEFTKIYDRIKAVLGSLITDFIAPILPKLAELSVNILQFVRGNRSQITAIVTIAGDAAVKIAEIIGKLVVMVVKQPEKILPIFSSIATAVLGFLGEITSSVFSPLLKFFHEIGSLVLKGTWTVVSTPFVSAWPLLRDNLMVLWRRVEKLTFEIAGWLFNALLGIPKKIWDWIKGAPAAVANILSVLAAVGQDIYVGLENIVRRQLLKLFSWVGNFFKEHQKLTGAMQYLGLGGVIESFSGFSDEYERISKELDKNATNTENAVNKTLGFGESLLLSAAKEFYIADVNLEQARKKLEKTKAGFSLESIKKTLVSDFGKVGEALKKSFENAFSVENMKNLEKGLSEGLSKIKDSFKDLPDGIRKDMDALVDMFGAKYYEAKLAEINAEKDAQKAALEDKTTTGDPNKKSREDDAKKEENRLETLQGLASNTGQMFSELYELSGKKMKEFFYAMKAASLAEAIINTAKGITGALSTPPVGPWNIAQAAMIGALGTVQVAKIASQGFATGGPVSGGSGIKDDVPAVLTAGEYVQPKASVVYYGERLMEAIRQRTIPREVLANFADNMPSVAYSPPMPAFSAGGMVAPSAQKPQDINFTNVNVVDPALFDQYMATSVGTKKFLNWIGNNAADVRRMLG